MQLPPERDWLCYCLDEALHVLAAGHAARDLAWADKFRVEPGDDGDAPNLYAKIRADRRSGKPPSNSDLAALRYAAEHSGMTEGQG